MSSASPKKPSARRNAPAAARQVPSSPRRETKASAEVSARFWLAYPPAKIQDPLIWELAQRYGVVTNIRQASVTDQLGIVCLEVSGSRKAVDDGVRWLKRKGVSVEPVELSTVAG